MHNPIAFSVPCVCLNTKNLHASYISQDNAVQSVLTHLVLVCVEFSGRLFDRVNLIKLVSNVSPFVGMCMRTYCMYVCTSIRPQKVSSISMKFGV